MSLQSVLTALVSSAGIAILILDGQSSLQAASHGIDLCLRTVIPSLFPFLFLCKLLTDSLWDESFPLLRHLGKLLGIPEGGESLLIAAVLGGYPAGALAVGQAYQSGKLQKQDAQRLLIFCSNAGPAFLFGMTTSLFSERITPWLIWAIQLLSCLMTGMLFRQETAEKTSILSQKASLSQVLALTIKTMGVICGWIVLFLILSDFLTRWFLWFFPMEVQILLTGLLELSNGCCSLAKIQNQSARFLLCSVMLSFGGLCVVMQTSSVIGNLSLRPYLLGKITQSLFAGVLSILYLRFGWITFPVCLLFLFLILKKEVDFRRIRVYNANITTRRKSHAISQKN